MADSVAADDDSKERRVEPYRSPKLQFNIILSPTGSLMLSGAAADSPLNR